MNLDYGIIGNCRTCALVKRDATISWLCLPRFDSPSVFAKILDPQGGECSVRPEGKHTTKQEYITNTAVLRTRFKGKNWAFSVYDFFPRYEEGFGKHNHLIRLFKHEQGKPKIKITFTPKPNYARNNTKLITKQDRIIAEHPKQKIHARTSIPKGLINKKSFLLDKNHFLVISENPLPEITHKIIQGAMKKTIAYWKKFVKETTIPKKYSSEVVRSAITLKLLQYEPTGAFVAAPTTSLPESIGDVRNWDYRYCWLRDAAFTIDAFTRLCRFMEAADFMRYLEMICKQCSKKPHLQIMYGIEGQHSLNEKKLGHLKGFKGSRPVRVGNAAYRQKQLDVAGEILDALSHFYVHYKFSDKLPDYTWQLVIMLVDQIRKNWRKKDHGLWEFRNTLKHFTHSKLLCWVGMNAAIKIAEEFNKKAPLEEWSKLKDEIRYDILENAWNPKRKAFTMAYGMQELDASVLQMPLLGFLDAKDPRMKSTINAIERELRAGCCFVFRYKCEDDFGKPKNTFSLCSLWFTQALYLSGQKKRAKKMFEHFLTHANHLGMFSEGLNPRNNELTGNFPQALTHLALINTAMMMAHKGVQYLTCPVKIEK